MMRLCCLLIIAVPPSVDAGQIMLVSCHPSPPVDKACCSRIVPSCAVFCVLPLAADTRRPLILTTSSIWLTVLRELTTPGTRCKVAWVRVRRVKRVMMSCMACIGYSIVRKYLRVSARILVIASLYTTARVQIGMSRFAAVAIVLWNRRHRSEIQRRCPRSVIYSRLPYG